MTASGEPGAGAAACANDAVALRQIKIIDVSSRGCCFIKSPGRRVRQTSVCRSPKRGDTTLINRIDKLKFVGHSSLDLAGAPQGAAGLCAGVLAIFYYLNTVDEDVLYSGRVLVRVLIRCVIGDSRRIEHDHVSEHTLLEKAAMIETEIGSGQPAQPANGFLKRDHFFIANILAEQPREVSVGSGMRGRL